MNDNAQMRPKRAAAWHAFESLRQEAAGAHAAAAEHLDSAKEWLALAGIPSGFVRTAEEVHGVLERAKTGVLEG